MESVKMLYKENGCNYIFICYQENEEDYMSFFMRISESLDLIKSKVERLAIFEECGDHELEFEFEDCYIKTHVTVNHKIDDGDYHTPEYCSTEVTIHELEIS